MKSAPRYLRHCLPILLGIAAPLASACEPGAIDAVLRKHFPQAHADRHGLLLVSGHAGMRAIRSEIQCRRWPSQPGLLLLALYWKPVEEVDGAWEGDLEVLVADADSHAVTARHRAPGRLVSDAFYVAGLMLDTARYDLAPSVRAFGVRIDHSSSSRVNPFREQTLDLYVLADSGLQPVLQGAVVASSWSEWDGRCDGEHSSSRSTVAVAESKANASGWRDLLVRNEHKEWQSRVVDGECIDMGVATSNDRLRLRFDGREYPVADQ